MVDISPLMHLLIALNIYTRPMGDVKFNSNFPSAFEKRQGTKDSRFICIIFCLTRARYVKLYANEIFTTIKFTIVLITEELGCVLSTLV